MEKNWSVKFFFHTPTQPTSECGRRRRFVLSIFTLRPFRVLIPIICRLKDCVLTKSKDILHWHPNDFVCKQEELHGKQSAAVWLTKNPSYYLCILLYHLRLPAVQHRKCIWKMRILFLDNILILVIFSRILSLDNILISLYGNYSGWRRLPRCDSDKFSLNVSRQQVRLCLSVCFMNANGGKESLQ